ncbi:hypothetical protein [Brevibacillus parabrevis]|uniref:hypothetical protein n=1 Tax=Brevibacillus parabrevis TaxID=54914 RepID=UPI003D1B0403
MGNNIIREDGMYGIKIVWPTWIDDTLADKRMGFPPGYDSKFDIPIKAKMLVYVTDYKAILAINEVTGTWEEGKKLYSPRGRFPLCLPIKENFRAKNGLPLKEVQEVIRTFVPREGLSFFPLSQAEYMELEQVFLQRG